MGSLIGITLNQYIALGSIIFNNINSSKGLWTCWLIILGRGCWEELEGLGQSLWKRVSLSLVVARRELKIHRDSFTSRVSFCLDLPPFLNLPVDSLGPYLHLLEPPLCTQLGAGIWPSLPLEQRPRHSAVPGKVVGSLIGQNVCQAAGGRAACLALSPLSCCCLV